MRDNRINLNGQWQFEIDHANTGGEHVGGYTSFAFDITDVAIRGGENTVVVYAYDNTRDPLQPTGKQDNVYDNVHKCWYYTRTTGIWQTVWIEFVPDTYIENHEPTEEELERFYKTFKEHVDILMDNKRMCAFCYCQWCDSAEHE